MAMSRQWETTMQSALLGTSRKPFVLASPATSVTEVLCAKLNVVSPEQLLLGAVAVESVAGRAACALSPGLPLPTPGSLDVAQQMDAKLSAIYRKILRLQKECLPEFHRLCAKAGKQVPNALLVDALVSCKGNRAVERSLIPLLGAQGQWLVQQNSDWAYAQINSEAAREADAQQAQWDKVWQESVANQRLLLLQELRTKHPSRALELLQSTWASESPEFRKPAVEALQNGLSGTDEPFLEICLDDKRKEVRTQARDLLLQLPGSAFSQRMLSRALQFVCVQNSQPGLLRRLTGLGAGKQLEVTLPSECSKDMERDGIAKKVPTYPAIGEKTWWLTQILSSVAPTTLAKALGMEWASFVEAFRSNPEWTKGIDEVLCNAALATRDSQAAFWLFRNSKEARLNLLEAMTPQQLEEIIVHSFSTEGVHALAAILHKLRWAGLVLPAKTASLLIRFIHQMVAAGNHMVPSHSFDAFADMALVLPLETCAEAVAKWPQGPIAELWQSNSLQSFFEIVHLRAEYHRHLPS